MSKEAKFQWLRPFPFIFLFPLFIVACAVDEPTATPTVVANVAATAVPSATPTPSHTPRPAVPSATPTETVMPTVTAVPTQTPIPLPLAPMTPFPTVTPDFVQYETKPVFIALIGCCGDGGGETDFEMGRDTPSLIIYGDGQMIIQEGEWGSRTFLEAYLSPQEMCQLRQQIADTGFLEPHQTFFTERDGSMGAGYLSIQVEDTYYSFYGPDVRFLVDDLAAGYHLIRNFRPQSPFTTYIPKYMVLWLEEIQPDENDVVNLWPSDLPPISQLWADREQQTILIEGDLLLPIFDLFDRQNAQRLFQEGEMTYTIIARPLLPNETPRRYPVFSGLPRDYVSVLSCEGEPSILSLAMPTVTPTLTAPTTRLTGQGRIVFTTGLYSDEEIYVMEADGSNRIQLTNNLVADSEPVWSPDGQLIAFTSKRTGNLDIFVMNADGTNVTQLTEYEYDDYSPTWSPDGSKIAFVSDRDGGWQKSEIYVMNTDGSAQERLTQNEVRDLTPVWSPDGRKIAFVQEIEHNISSALLVLYLHTFTTDVVYVDQPSPTEKRETWITHLISRPAWSPDSTQLSITVLPNRSDVIQVFDLNGTELQNFAVSPLDQRNSLDWSADGSFIVFSARMPNEGENAIHYSEDQNFYGNWGIYALDLKTGEVIQITFSEQDEFDPALWP